MQQQDYLTPPLPAGIKLKWKGVFDAEAVYKRIKYWLDFNGYGGNFEEEEYSELLRGDTKNIGFRWHAEKKVTGYFGYVIEINIHITGMGEVTVPRNGMQLKMNTGNFEARLAGYIVKDINNKYKSKAMQKFYERVVIKGRVDEHKGLMATKIYELQEEIKRFLGMP